MINTKTTKSNSIFSGVIILTVANIIVKIIGFIYKIPLLKILGENGMAYYNSAYQIYTWFYTLSTAGLPLAVAKLIAQSRASGKYNRAKKTLNIALIVFGAVGIVGSTLMIVFSSPLADLQQNKDVNISIIALAPALFFICLTSAMRGFFQGHERMLPTAVSEVIEAASKLVLGIILLNVAKNLGLGVAYQAAFAILGVTIGSILSTLYLWITKILSKKDEEQVDPSEENTSYKSLSKSLLNIAIPISLSSSVMSIASLIDTFVMIRALTSIGYSDVTAQGIFGNYTTQCVTMYNLPTVLVTPIAVGIVPFLSAMLEKNDRVGYKKTASSAVKMTNVIAFPCALGLCAMSFPILKMVFDNNTEIIAPMLSVLSIAIIFIGLVTVTNVILQTYNKQYLTLVSIACGTIVKFVCATLFTGIDGKATLGILGTPASTVVCYFVASLMNIIFVLKYTGVTLPIINVFIRPLLAASSSALSAYFIYNISSSVVGMTLSVLGAIMSAVIVYIIALFLFKVITKEDIILLPKSQKIISVLSKLHLIK